MGDANSCHISKDRIGQVSTNNAHYQIYMSPKHCIVNSVRERIANVIAILSVLSTSMSITLVRRCVNNCVFIAANNKTPTPIPTVNRRRSRFFIMLISSLFWSSSGAWDPPDASSTEELVGAYDDSTRTPTTTICSSTLFSSPRNSGVRRVLTWSSLQMPACSIILFSEELNGMKSGLIGIELWLIFEQNAQWWIWFSMISIEIFDDIQIAIKNELQQTVIEFDSYLYRYSNIHLK